MTVPRLLFAGGGTAGHVFPAVAVAQAVLRRHPDARVLFALPSGRGNFLRGTRWQAVTLPSPRPSKVPWKWPLFGLAGLGAGIGSLRLLLGMRPHAVIGTGGYASAPLVFTARLLGIPVLLLEPNAVAGKANRFLSRFAQDVAAAWEFDYEPWSERTRRHPFASTTRLEITGTPVREEILATEEAGPRPLGILVFGGSLGASALNRVAAEALPEVARAFPRVGVRHISGHAEEARTAEAYRRAGTAADVRAFLSDMRRGYREADVVVCRAGGNTLAEVLALGKAAVLVPLPRSADGHQKANALQAAQRGAAVMIEEAELTPARLAAEVSRLLGDAKARDEMGRRARALGKPEAARRVAERVLALAEGRMRRAG